MKAPRIAAMLAALIVGYGLACGSSARADATQDCRSGPPEARVMGCSSLLAEARTARQRAIALDGRCKAHNDRSAYSDALTDCTSAVRADDAYPYSYSNRGIAHASLSNHAAAIQDFTRAHSLRPAFAWLLINRAKSYVALGNVALALADYEEALRMKPDNEEARSALAALRDGAPLPASATAQPAASSLCGNAGCR